MRSKGFAAVWSALGVVLLVCGLAYAEDDKGAEQAKKALGEFGAKLAGNDLDGVLKSVDLPFFCNATDPEKGEVIRDREAMKKLMQPILDTFKSKKAQLEVVKVLSYDKFLEAAGDKLSKADRKLLDEVLKKDGYALQVEVKNGEGKRINRWTCFVASPGGQPKVVGLKD